ncbi:membrane hypothetical protein [Candidatus Desulfarcum epimagneticum]|uniref:Uncharacterized protein n=1 Tax=uncultured Desulfobacteraceae bacterium TaxID=218296 RepID=A0A484HK50_9BACT|nr:membrane hypothetical protein [uncultured Desulfobacteraceae bacterium]
MGLLRDIVRDGVGILFPGGFLVFFILWAFSGLILLFFSLNVFSIILKLNSFLTFSAFLIFSYIAGQSLRLKRLDDLEKKSVTAFRKKRIKRIKNDDGKKAKIKAIHGSFKIDSPVEEYNNLFRRHFKVINDQYYARKITTEEYKLKLHNHFKIFNFWEKFPYPLRVTEARLRKQTQDYIDFFEKYDREGIMSHSAFFNFCKSVIFESSSSFKEEMRGQESLVRLFAGVFYAIKYSFILNLLVIFVFICIFFAKILDFEYFSLVYRNVGNSIIIFFLLTVFVLIIFRYLDWEIKKQLRFMRLKEVHLAFDGFYIISKKTKINY